MQPSNNYYWTVRKRKCFLVHPCPSDTQRMHFFKIFKVSLNFSTFHFAHFSWCRASSVSRCYSILECSNLFSGIKLSIRSFCFIECAQWRTDLGMYMIKINRLSDLSVNVTSVKYSCCKSSSRNKRKYDYFVDTFFVPLCFCLCLGALITRHCQSCLI